ncbi:hypothetical protein CYMTET_32032 [Cymbomonas tetramitiformis]|uniref:Uncharacterized protein n=1 Tax=Cymbomonas tetramitiformis TaxID=36881 RepID=A0AAE0KSB7_9CHLO|nr:hypothetical protein CYMTET_32032 [Cymbomonas tetramitiformis]
MAANATLAYGISEAERPSYAGAAGGVKATPGLIFDIPHPNQLIMLRRGAPGIAVLLDDILPVTDTKTTRGKESGMLLEWVQFVGSEADLEKKVAQSSRAAAVTLTA